MLVSLKTVLDIAEEKKCAIPAFNVYNAETALGVLRAAEEAGSCVILQMYSRLFSNFEAEFMMPSLVEAARRAGVRVAAPVSCGTPAPCPLMRMWPPLSRWWTSLMR